MKDHNLDHIKAVLSEGKPPTPEDLPLIHRLAGLQKCPDFDSVRGYSRLINLIETRKRQKRWRKRVAAIGAMAAGVILALLVLLPREERTVVTEEASSLVAYCEEVLLTPDSLRSDRDLRLECEDGKCYHLRLSDQDTLRLSEISPLLPLGKDISMIVPETRRGRLLLSDGTLITLNAASRLVIPHTFGKRRALSLEEGEVLMQVTHDEKRPFTVSARDMQIQVLGTTFDICLYPEQPVTATLLEGSLRVNLQSGDALLLHPGEEVAVKEGELSKYQADLSSRTAWVDGTFIFQHLPLSAIMEYAGRWYGFETIYAEESLKHNTFTGALKKEYSEDFVFDVLEKTTRLKINHQPENRRVTVSHR